MPWTPPRLGGALGPVVTRFPKPAKGVSHCSCSLFGKSLEKTGRSGCSSRVVGTILASLHRKLWLRAAILCALCVLGAGAARTQGIVTQGIDEALQRLLLSPR